jgi:hypothetical protein
VVGNNNYDSQKFLLILEGFVGKCSHVNRLVAKPVGQPVFQRRIGSGGYRYKSGLKI